MKTTTDIFAQKHHTNIALSEMFGRGMIYAAVFAFQTGAMIVITPIAVRNLSKFQFGRFVTVFSIVQLLIAVLGFGLGTAIQRQYSQDTDDLRDTRGLLGVGIAMAIVATFLADLTGPLWAGLLRVGPYDSSLRFGVWAGGLAAIALLMSQLFRSQDRLAAFVIVMAPLAIGSQVIGLAFVIWVSPAASSYLAGICVGEFAAVIVGLLLARPRFLRLAKRGVVVSALALALPLVPNGIAYQILNLGDRIVVQHKLGQFAVGRYQLAYNAAALTMLALMLLSMAWLPRVFSIKDDILRKAVLAESRDELYRILVPLNIGVTLAAPIVLRILAPVSYKTNDLLLVVSLVAISAVPFSAYLASSRVLIIFGRTRCLIWITPLAAVINVALNIAFVPLWGIDASAAATLISYTALALLSGLASQRVAKLPPTPLMLWAAVLLSSVACWSVSTLPTTPVFLVLRSILAILCAVWVIARVVRLVNGKPRARHRRRRTLSWTE